MKRIRKFDEACRLIKAGEILVLPGDSSIGPTYIKSIRSKITMINQGIKAVLSQIQFEELFKEGEFYIFENKEESIDLKRDQEYYSWKKK